MVPRRGEMLIIEYSWSQMVLQLVGRKFYLSLICISVITSETERFKSAHYTWCFLCKPFLQAFSNSVAFFSFGYLYFYFCFTRTFYMRYSNSFLFCCSIFSQMDAWFSLYLFCMFHYTEIVNIHGARSDNLISWLVFFELWFEGSFFFFLLTFYSFIFRARGREEEKRERNINVWLPLTRPLLGTWPTTKACALTGNETSHPLVCRPAPNLLSHTCQGCSCCF